MSIKTEQIITLLQLKGLGRKTAFKICEKAVIDDLTIASEIELMDFLEMCFANKEISRLSNYTNFDFENASTKSKLIIEKSELNGIKITSYYDKKFPRDLKNIKDPPIIINTKGNLSVLNQITGIAIIGTREPTIEGIQSGLFLGEIFGKQNYNVVSGLAKGCDTAAHKGCLKAGGITTGVLAHGLQMTYPKENEDLADQILSKDGVLVSEYFVGTKPLPNYFVERDRLQAGLSIATIVIQTAIKGGTMHAVNATLDSNKLLAAVKYNDDFKSDKILGNLHLINEKNAFALQSNNYPELINKLKILNQEIKNNQDLFQDFKIIIDVNNQLKLPF